MTKTEELNIMINSFEEYLRSMLFAALSTVLVTILSPIGRIGPIFTNTHTHLDTQPETDDQNEWMNWQNRLVHKPNSRTPASAIDFFVLAVKR